MLTQLCPILCDSMDYNPPGSSSHRIFQAIILEKVAIFYSKGSSWPREWTHISWVSCIHGISHARILEWVAIFYSKGSSWPRDGTVSLAYPALAGGFFTTERPGKGCYTQCCPLIPRHLLKKERKKERKYMSTEILVYECSLQHRNLNINVLICSL